MCYVLLGNTDMTGTSRKDRFNSKYAYREGKRYACYKPILRTPIENV